MKGKNKRKGELANSIERRTMFTITIVNEHGTVLDSLNVTLRKDFRDALSRTEKAIREAFEEHPFRLLECDKCGGMVPRDLMREDLDENNEFVCYVCTPKSKEK